MKQNGKRKKGDARSIRLSPVLHQVVKELADAHYRTYNEEVNYLIAKGAHIEQFNIKRWL